MFQSGHRVQREDTSSRLMGFEVRRIQCGLNVSDFLDIIKNVWRRIESIGHANSATLTPARSGNEGRALDQLAGFRIAKQWRIFSVWATPDFFQLMLGTCATVRRAGAQVETGPAKEKRP